MKTLENTAERQEILERVAKLGPQTERLWGKMTCPQMICHLNDCFLLPLGERPSPPIDNFLTRTILKRIALYVPIRWPHGYKSRPEFDQMAGGTPPQIFENDLARFHKLFDRFVKSAPQLSWRHPSFGPMSLRDTMRWAYLHMDHHFRQFGV
jgi:hypothetical protein